MRAFEIREFGFENLKLVKHEEPKPAAGEVLVRFHAVSLNYRDLMVIKGVYNPKLRLPLVPFSDGAGEIVEVGTGVTRFQVGDRVCPSFFQDWTDGEIDYSKSRSALGGDLDGCLKEYAVFNEAGLVNIPQHLSYDEAATLPCAGVTAWNALFESGGLEADETVLTLGTGGVSLFALQFAMAAGARVVVTSSSDVKLERAKELGAFEVVNYKNLPDWDKEVGLITKKRGVDHIIEVGGAGTIQKSIGAARMGGHIALIGVLSKGDGINPVSVLMKALRLQGIFVGSRKMFEDMNAFLFEHDIKPLIDRKFAFEDTISALEFMENGKHFGKIVVNFGQE